MWLTLINGKYVMKTILGLGKKKKKWSGRSLHYGLATVSGKVREWCIWQCCIIIFIRKATINQCNLKRNLSETKSGRIE